MTTEDAKRLEKREKTVGYILLVIGLIFIILPAALALWMFLASAQPQLVPIPTASEDEFTKAFATFSNVCLIFFIFIIILWAGSIISSRAVTMIKDVKLKLVKKSLNEAAEAINRQESDKE
jgi:sterol desaturase/sphingolipid hydroxylase (fatty acid hydroxylase superfamily)